MCIAGMASLNRNATTKMSIVNSKGGIIEINKNILNITWNIV